MANEKQKEFRFTEKMISRIRDFNGDDPTKSIDRITSEQKKIAEVNIPSKSFRNYRFGKDADGRDLDTYTAYINVPTSVIGLNLKGVNRNEARNWMLYGDKSHFFNKQDKSIRDDFTISNLYMYADVDRNFMVRFRPKTLEDGKFDQPSPISISGNDLADMYRDMFNKELHVQPQVESEPKSKTESKSAKDLSKAKENKAKAKTKADSKTSKTKATTKAKEKSAKSKTTTKKPKKTVDRSAR